VVSCTGEQDLYLVNVEVNSLELFAVKLWRKLCFCWKCTACYYQETTWILCYFCTFLYWLNKMDIVKGLATLVNDFKEYPPITWLTCQNDFVFESDSNYCVSNQSRHERPNPPVHLSFQLPHPAEWVSNSQRRSRLKNQTTNCLS
jgi:hypothetical protein